MTGFQTLVNLIPAPAVAGDFASANPRSSVIAQEGALVAGSEGVTVGLFAWIDTDGKTVHNHGTAPAAPDGFVHRDQQALITQYLGEASMVIPGGFPVTLQRTGDYFAKVAGSTAATRGATVYAGYSDGSINIGSAPTSASVTASLGSTNTASLGATFTASAHSLDNTRIDVTGVTGYIAIGDTVSGAGITGGQTIVSQDSGGTPNGAGTYVLSGTNTATSATCTCFGKTVKVTSTTGLISLGDVISGGAGFPVGATLSTLVSGSLGGAGVYTVSAGGTAYTASATGVTTFGTVLDVTAVGSGALSVGNPVTGAGMPTAVITGQLSGTAGNTGTYSLSVAGTAYAASTTVTVVEGVSSGWTASSANAIGELTVITK